MDEKEFYSTIGKMFKKDPETLGPDTKLKDDLGATSQMMFGVSALLERLSGKKVAFSEINNCKTLGDAINLVK